MNQPTRAGMVAIVGMPNAGKSSLLNKLVDTRLSIVSPAAQTTRERVVGIDSRDGIQMVFIDTPGIVRPAYLLHEAMLGIIEQTIDDADVVVLLIDLTRGHTEIPETVLDLIRARSSSVVVALNKADLAGGDSGEQESTWSKEQFGSQATPISARTGQGIELLRARIAEKLPESPFLYPDDDVSSQSVRFFLSEFIREAVFETYEEEIPYSVAVRIEEMREDEDPVFIRAVLYVERPSQKGILIGRSGVGIKALGTRSRAKIEEFLGARAYLDLWVKVLPKWRKSPQELRRLGFPVPEEKD